MSDFIDDLRGTEKTKLPLHCPALQGLNAQFCLEYQ